MYQSGRSCQISLKDLAITETGHNSTPSSINLSAMALATFCSVLFLLLATSVADKRTPFIRSFRSCPDLSIYYVNHVLPLVGPYGLTSSNAYTYLRPPANPEKKNRPGGPANLRLKRLARDPQRVQFNNISSGIDQDNDVEQAGPTNEVSKTNVQVRGVDEPDIIKTDGRRMYTLSGNVFSVVKILQGGRKGRRIGKLHLPSSPLEMLIEKNWVLAIAVDNSYRRPVFRRYRVDPSGGEKSTLIYQIYVGGKSPKLVSTLHLEGRYVKSRETKGVARLVMHFKPLSSIWLYYKQKGFPGKLVEKWNREIIMYSRPGNWLPTYMLRKMSTGNVRYGTYVDCAEVYYSPDRFAGFNMLTVVTLRMDKLLAPKATATVISDADRVFATKDNMYVTTSEFRFNDVGAGNRRWGSNYLTSVHKFGLSDKGASYTASGRITGSLLNQFSMSEHRGILFVATTDGAPWWSLRDLSASKVTAFKTVPRRRRLRKIGQVGNLGVGERIFAVRFRRDTAYVVTFREVDPLYVVDLSDPRRMLVTGELKIPGFSSYLHIVDGGRLLGVGREATISGVTTGSRVSLFDVRDKTKPVELSSWTLTGSYSTAEWDHRAFLYWKNLGIAVMPVNIFGRRRTFRGTVLLKVGVSNIREIGRITHTGNRFKPNILRNAIIGNRYLWSMSSNLLQVNDLRELRRVQSIVNIAK